MKTPGILTNTYTQIRDFGKNAVERIGRFVTRTIRWAEGSGGVPVVPKSPESAADLASMLRERMVSNREAEGFERLTTLLHDKGQAFKTNRALSFANQIIADSGAIDVEVIPYLRAEVKRHPSKSVLHDRQVEGLLRFIEESRDFREALFKVGAPISEKVNPAIGRILRSTLHLPSDAPLSSVQAKRAILSTLLAELRQGDIVGSCFATAHCIMQKETNPLMVLHDLRSMVEQGKIVKKIPKSRNGGEYVLELDVSKQMINSAWTEKVGVNSEGELFIGKRKLGKGDVDVLVKRLIQFGLFSDEKEALEGMQKVIDYHKPEAIPMSELFDPQIERYIIGAVAESCHVDKVQLMYSGVLSEYVKTHNREKLLEDAVKVWGNEKGRIIYDQIVKAVEGTVELGKNRLKEVSVEKIVQQMIANKLGLKVADFRNKKRLQELSRRIHELNVDLTDIQKKSFEYTRMENELNRLIDEYEKLSGVVRSKEKLYEEFDRLAMQVEDYFYGIGENRLLRSWEYTVAAAGRSIVVNDQSDEVYVTPAIQVALMGESRSPSKGVLKGLDKLLEQIVSGPNAGGYNRLVQPATNQNLIRKFQILVNARLATRYEQGKFVVYDKTEVSHLSAAPSLDTPEKLVKVAIGLLLETSREESLKLNDENAAKQLRALGTHLAREMSRPEFLEHATRTFLEARGLGDEIKGKELPSDEKLMTLVNKHIVGARGEPLIHMNYGTMNITGQSVPMKDPRSAFKYFVELGRYWKGLGYDVSSEHFVMQAQTKGHELTIKPFLFKDAINSKLSPEEYLQRVVVEGRKSVAFADLNWESEGEQVHYVFRVNDKGRVEYGYESESGRGLKGIPQFQDFMWPWTVFTDPKELGQYPQKRH